MRTLDDILPKLSKARTVSMGDATSGYWHVPLDLHSSQGSHSDWKTWKKWEGIFQSGKSQGILNRLEKSGKSQGKPHKILEN